MGLLRRHREIAAFDDREPFDNLAEQIEADMAETVHTDQHQHPRDLDRQHYPALAAPQQQPQAIDTALPSYVQHRPDVDQIGRLSAQVVAASFEKTAQQIQTMASELIEMGRRCNDEAIAIVNENNALQEKIAAVVAECQRTAGYYREEAKFVFERIQQSSVLADQVRAVCMDMNERIQRHEPKPEDDQSKSQSEGETEHGNGETAVVVTPATDG
jgi:hypothetical protein